MSKPYQRKSDGMWCQAIELPSEGTRRRRKVIVRAKQADLVQAVRDARRELARTGDLPTASPTLATWLDGWLERRARDRLKPRSADDYESKARLYIKPAIGRVRLDKLTPTHVQKVHDYVTGQGLSSTTALQAHRVLAKALTDAERAGKVSRNVARLVDAPRKAFAPRPALTVEDARALLLSVAKDTPAAARWGVALLAGLRQGEALGLTRDAIDYDKGIITVSWQLQRLKWAHGCPKDAPCTVKRAGNCPARKVTIPPGQEATRVDGGLWRTRPKSRTGWREVPIAPGLDHYLENYGPDGIGGLIFHRAGRPIDPSDDSAAWDAACRAAGVADVPLHSARHTCSSLLAALGVPEQIRMQILGHSSAEVNRGYTHVTSWEAREAMVKLGDLLALPAGE